MAGGALGAGLRFEVGRLASTLLPTGFPWATLTVNLAGSFAMGVLGGLIARLAAGGGAAGLFLGVGVLGGFTTFSAFSMDAVLLLERGETGLAAAYALASLVGSVALLLAGLLLARTAL